MEKVEIRSLLEALMFTATEPLTLDHFLSVIPDVEKNTIQEVLAELQQDLETRDSGFVLREVASGSSFLLIHDGTHTFSHYSQSLLLFVCHAQHLKHWLLFRINNPLRYPKFLRSVRAMLQAL